MLFARAVVLILATATPSVAQTAASAPQDPKAQAQFEFMMARRPAPESPQKSARKVAR